MSHYILTIDCIYLTFTFQLENDCRTVETSLLFNVNFFSEKVFSFVNNIAVYEVCRFIFYFFYCCCISLSW